jgi:putative ABC transport system permease protein
MKYLPYVLRHISRNRVRTLSTVFGMALCIFLICTLRTVLSGMDASLRSARPDRLATRHAVSVVFTLPDAYRSRIAAIPGIKRVSANIFFGGLLGSGGSQDFANFFANFAVEPEPYFAMYPEYAVPPDQWAAFLADRRGAIIGKDLADRFGWTIGSTFQLTSFIPPYQTGRPFEFAVRGIFHPDPVRYPGTNEMQMLFRFDYFTEATKRRAGVGMFMLQVDDPARAAEVSKIVDEGFENSDVQTKTESEAVFRQSFNALAGNLVLLLNAIGLAVAFTVLLVSANTMSMAVRERRTEIAVLKTIGFSSGRVMALILVESAVLAACAGGLGIGLASLLVSNVNRIPGAGALGQFGGALQLSVSLAAGMLGFTVLLGCAAGLVPALGAYRAKIVDALRAA